MTQPKQSNYSAPLIKINVTCHTSIEQMIKAQNELITDEVQRIFTEVVESNPNLNLQSKQQGIGDTGCIYNAKSLHLQCAIAPDGDCKTCLHHSRQEINL